jgi:hypothetical protein
MHSPPQRAAPAGSQQRAHKAHTHAEIAAAEEEWGLHNAATAELLLRRKQRMAGGTGVALEGSGGGSYMDRTRGRAAGAEAPPCAPASGPVANQPRAPRALIAAQAPPSHGGRTPSSSTGSGSTLPLLRTSAVAGLEGAQMTRSGPGVRAAAGALAATGTTHAGGGYVSDRHAAQRNAVRNLRMLRAALDAGMPVSLGALTRVQPRAGAGASASGMTGAGGLSHAAGRMARPAPFVAPSAGAAAATAAAGVPLAGAASRLPPLLPRAQPAVGVRIAW